MSTLNSTQNSRIKQLQAAAASLRLARQAFKRGQEADGITALAVALRRLPAADRAAVLARFDDGGAA